MSHNFGFKSGMSTASIRPCGLKKDMLLFTGTDKPTDPVDSKGLCADAWEIKTEKQNIGAKSATVVKVRNTNPLIKTYKQVGF